MEEGDIYSGVMWGRGCEVMELLCILIAMWLHKSIYVLKLIELYTKII